MFIGPDQAQRTEQERLKNLQNQKALEKVLVTDNVSLCMILYFIEFV